MIDTVVAIGVLQRTDGVWRPFGLLYGQLPQDFETAALNDVCGDRPALRKIRDQLVVVVPEAAEHWVIWIFSQVPPVTVLQSYVETLVGVTRGLRVAPVVRADEKHNILALLVQRLAQAGKRSPAVVAQLITDGCVEAGLARAAVCVELRGGKLRGLYASDTELLVQSDEIRMLLRRRLGPEPQMLRPDPDDMDTEALDTALLADNFAAQSMVLGLPAKDETGLALVLLDPLAELKDDTIRELDALYCLSIRARRSTLRKARWLRPGLYAALASGLIWLALPAPLIVQSPVTSVPLNAQALVAPVASYADVIQVRVGDRVQEGDVIARLRAPDLEEQRAAIGAEIAIETVAAQAALSMNDYGNYLLSQQKLEAATLRLTRVTERLDALMIRAPQSGRIVFSVPPDVAGRYLALGETIALIQPSPEFGVQLEVARVDAALLRAGLAGEVWFRGLPGVRWQIETETPVSWLEGNAQDDDQLIVRARILDAQQERLIGGLTGFARVHVGEDFRIRVFGRYVIEYLRSKAWIWFGLTF